MNIGMLIIMLVGGLAGILSTLYLLVSLPVVVIQKVYRKVRFGTPIMSKSCRGQIQIQCTFSVTGRNTEQLPFSFI